MRSGLSLLLLFCIGSAVILSSYSIGPAHRINWDGTGASGTYGCNKTGGCHHSTTGLNTTIELDSAGVAVWTYHPGASYTIKVSARNGTNDTFNTLPYFGFQMAAVRDSGSGTISAIQAGTWGALPAGVQNTPADSPRTFPIIEHSADIHAASGSGGPGTLYSESIPWTAPTAGTGSITIYGAINAVTGYDLEYLCYYQVAPPVTIAEGLPTGIRNPGGTMGGFCIYPEPLNDFFTLSFELKEGSDVSITLISMEGHSVKVFMPEEPVGMGVFRQIYNVAGLPTGIYLLRLQAGGESVVTKVVKE